MHIVWHREHVHSDCYHVCSADTDFHETTRITTEKDNLCPICEYKFSINDVPVLAAVTADIPKARVIFNATILVQPHLQIFEQKSPRAPPLSI